MVWECRLPRAVQLVIDDVGWREGWRLDDEGGPYRAGIGRLLGPADYQAIADLGRRLGIRPTAATILCEWDLHNRCAGVPTATAAGADWDNSARVGPWMSEAADIYRDEAAYLELALHGVGHEHWSDGVMTRAEWYGRGAGKWPWEVLQAHLRLYRELLDDHGLGPADGHRFPLHAVPCAFSYLWDPADPESTGALFREAGVQFCSTPFGSLSGAPDPLAPDGGLDHGLLVLDRGNSGVPWFEYDLRPGELTDAGQMGSFCGIHWPNLLCRDPADNGQAVDRWAEFLTSGVGGQPGQILAANSREAFAQWAWHTFGRVTGLANGLRIDLTAVPEAVRAIVGEMPVIVELDGRLEPGALRSRGLRPLWVREGSVRTQMAFKVLDGRVGEAIFDPAAPPAPLVWRDGTANVLDLVPAAADLTLDLEVYGVQTLTLAPGFVLAGAEVVGGRLTLGPVTAAGQPGRYRLTVTGQDIQGERGRVRLGRG